MTADPTPEDRDAGDSLLDTPVEVDPPAGTAAPAEAGDGDRVLLLEAQVAKLEQEKKENWDKFLRAAADLENHRRRSKRDLDDARAEAKTRVLKEMLPVVDNLERGLQHAESAAAGDTAAVIDGIRLVLRQFAHAFERVDVHPVDAQGQPFDPNVHEAISQAETAEHPPGTVVSVLQRGYKLGDRLLRPALVVVAKAPSSSAPQTAPGGDGGEPGAGEGA